MRNLQELRTPLHGIISATSLLIESQLTDEQREYGAVILSASRSLLTLVDDILDLTRIRVRIVVRCVCIAHSAQVSKLRIELRSCKVLPVVETVFEVLSAAAGEKGVDLAYEIEGEEAYRTLRSRLFVSDPQRLQQVLMNLMSNAIKVTRTRRPSASPPLSSPPAATSSSLSRSLVRRLGATIGSADLTAR